MALIELPATSELRLHLQDRETWLDRACGPALPAWSDAVQGRVEAALASWEKAGRRLECDFEAGWSQGISPVLLPSLAVAYRQNGDPRLPLLARGIYELVLNAEPWHAGWRPPPSFNILAIPHRLGDTECTGWFGSLPAFLECDVFDDAFVEQLVQSATAQLEYLSGTLHESRNIRLSQADALLTQGLRLSLLPQAQRWRAIGVHALNDGFHRLIAPDGASREATAWYHFIIMNMGLRLWRLQQADPALSLTMTPAQVAGMFDYTLASIEPDGRSTRIGDTCGSITPARSLDSFIRRRAAARAELGFGADLPDPTQLFADVKQAFVRSDWSDQADYLTFDATTREGYHWHPGRNSLQLCVAGQRILADPGRMSYKNTPFRKYATSTRGHSTINMNGWDQSDTPAQLRVQQAGSVRLLQGSYAGGYWRMEGFQHEVGIFGQHDRLVYWPSDRFLLVIDHVAHTAGADRKPDIESMWHFSPGSIEANTRSRWVRAVRGEQAATLDLQVVLCPEAMSMSVHQGQQEPTLGWAAHDRTDQPEPAPSIRLHLERYDPWRLDLATLLIPGRKGQQPLGCTVAAGHDASRHRYAHLDLRWSDGSCDRFWWTRRLETALDEVDGIKTDAGLLHVASDDRGQIQRVTLAGGTFAGDWFLSPAPTPGLHWVELK